MQILNLQRVYFQPTDRRFGPSKLKSTIFFVILAVVLAFLLIATAKNREWFTFAFISFIGGLGLLGIGSWVVKAFKRDGWKIAIQNSALLLKADITEKDSQDVLEIQFREIASIRRIRERYIRYNGGRNATKPVRFDILEIQLTPDAYAQLVALVGIETKGLEMTAPNRLIYPTGIAMLNTEKIVSDLETYCPVQESQVLEYDLPDLKDKNKVDSYILFLARRSHEMDAQSLATDAFKMEEKDSQKYISDLMRKALAK